MKDAATRITEAKTQLILFMPFFASVLLRLVVAEDNSSPTMWTDTVYLGYNSNFVQSLNNKELAGVLCHEVMHVALKHPLRRGSRNHIVWNMACDYAINQIVLDAKAVLPKGCLVDKKYQGMSAEHIYDELMKDAQSEAKGAKALMPGETRDYKQGGPSKDSSPNDGKGIVVDKDLYKAGTQEQDKNIDKMVAEAAVVGRAAGNIPGSLDRLITKLLNPVLPWKEILARYITERASDDYSWKQASRRYLHAGMYLPSLSSPKMADVGVIIDTSASLSIQDIHLFAAEVHGILNVIPGTKAHVLYVDTKVQEYEELSLETIGSMKPKGGGGTDFKPGFAWFKEKDMDLACIIYLTDGECNSFPADDKVDTLWVLTQECQCFNPPFGETIIMHP